MKKFLSYLLVLLTLVNSITPALAATTYTDSTEHVDYIEHSDEYDGTLVYAEIGSKFKVTIPKKIILDGGTKSGTYQVTVTGDIAGTEYISVMPDKSFILSSKNLPDVTAMVNQDKTFWRHFEILENSIIGNGLIDANKITAGSWNGTFNFNISLTECIIGVFAENEIGTDLNAFAINIVTEDQDDLFDKLEQSELVECEKIKAIVEVDSDEFSNMAKTTFNVSNIAQTGDYIMVLHYDDKLKKWEHVATEKVNDNGTIIVYMDEYSPVAFAKVEEPHEHSYEETIKAATCLTDGSKVYTCKCGDTYTTIINKLGHEYKNGKCIRCNEADPDYLIAGLYDSSGTLLCTWEQSGIKLNMDYSGSTYDSNYWKTCSTSAYYILKNKYPTATKIIIPSSVTYIGIYSFSNCKQLTEIILPNGLKQITKDAFYACKGLTKITIPSSVTALGGSGNPFRAIDNITVTFEDPYGWYCSSSATGTKTKVDNANITFPDYPTRYWTK